MASIFSKIIAGEIPAAKLYEDDSSLCFLDIGPLRPGHALVIPKKEVATINELTSDEAGHLLVVAQTVMPHLLAEVGADGATLAIHDGVAAGQEVPHVHLHIVPRTAGDGGGPIHALFQDRPESSPSELKALAERVALRLDDAA